MRLKELLKNAVLTVGDFSLFVLQTLRSGLRLWRRRGIFYRQCEFIGVSSLGVCAVAGIFMGGVLGYQLYMSFHIFGAEALLGGTVGVGLFRELAPVMTGVMVTGRAGAAIAAEIASMRVTEQVDALEVMAVDPIEYLVAPRVMAGVITMPLLSVFFTAIASLAAAIVSCGVMDLQWQIFWTQYARICDPIDMVHCVTKGAAFGLILSWVACFCGYRASGGARAVGAATRNTVVSTFLTILFFDYILTSLLPYGLAKLKVL